ncbi:hypothetical protein CCHR01_13043 [Colletotrichum chrysophilum]|uniref:Uncharacterized protein n=1 Tax=Colletotrichum chrysophilum TaxID=1836956 RepID=A0AAD9AA52_9PEZI|nr:hypothetical protein CCHR01_13043 [Colletotrichum chrysophilum]
MTWVWQQLQRGPSGHELRSIPNPITAEISNGYSDLQRPITSISTVPYEFQMRRRDPKSGCEALEQNHDSSPCLGFGTRSVRAGTRLERPV